MLTLNTRLLIGLVLISSSFIVTPPAGRAFAQSGLPERLPERYPAKARFDDACAMFAATKVAGYSDEKEQQWISDCSRHPDIMTCVHTKRFIEDARKRPLPELICGPGSKGRGAD